jgi:hypothetical protein
MGLLKRIKTSLQYYGLEGTAIKLCWWIIDYLFDIRYRIDTVTIVTLEQRVFFSPCIA